MIEMMRKRIKPPHKQLFDLGFIEIKDNVFLKQLEDNIKFYRDYRKDEPTSYAYFRDKRVEHNNFKDHDVIIKIEKQMKQVK